MGFSFKHKALLCGLILFISSFLFFGRHQDLYQLLNITGLALSIVFFLAVLLKTGTAKSKISWTILIIVFVVFQRQAEPFLIDTSFRIYILKNKNTLAKLNNLLLNKSGDINLLNDHITNPNTQLSVHEWHELIQGKKKINVYMISKSDKGIYYGLWGFLDVRLGIYYVTAAVNPDNSYRHLTGNWFR